MQVVENLKSCLPARVASTIEFWSRLDHKGFGTVTVHWITSNWSLEEAVLGAKSLDCVIGFNDEITNGKFPEKMLQMWPSFILACLKSSIAQGTATQQIHHQ